VAKGVDEVHHLAFVNGTEFFYSQPDLVLDVGVRGILNVIDACRKHGIGTLVLVSSSEVYQTPPKIPTDQRAPLSIPDPLNPRYSYGGGKLISELMAINFGRKYFERVLIFRPHNVYGPDMGFEHVSQFALRLHVAASGILRFEIQGTGKETRSFCFIDDLVAGVMAICEKGEHLGIYHVGTLEEVTIAELRGGSPALPGVNPAPGGTARRCPDISKLTRLGYKPRVLLSEGLKPTLDWYWRQRRARAGKPDAEGELEPCVAVDPTTKLPRDNFADLQRESAGMLGLGGDGLVVDIGSNDGTLLSNFKNAVMD
jgi:nucleoside-diphosphate-sugar epimerase